MKLPGRQGKYEVVSVDDLPWPENLFKSCGLKDALHQRHPNLGELPDEDRTRIVREFLQSQALSVIRQCPYHAGDPARAASIAVKLMHDGVAASGSQAIGDAIAGEPEAVQSFVESLFRDPITWRRGQPLLTDGPHRVCALKLVDAAACPVRVS